MLKAKLPQISIITVGSDPFRIDGIPIYIHKLGYQLKHKQLKRLQRQKLQPGIHYAVSSTQVKSELIKTIQNIIEDNLNDFTGPRAPAGINRGVISPYLCDSILTRDERDTLYALGINPIHCYPGLGLMLWGNRFIDENNEAQTIVESSLYCTTRTYINQRFHKLGEKHELYSRN